MKKYLRRVVYCGAGSMEEVLFEVSPEALADDDIEGKEEGILYLTDGEDYLKYLKGRGLPVAVWLHEQNRDQDFSGAAYVIEDPKEVETAYYEKIYRRELGIPWDILETERCLIREMIPEDAEAFEAIYRESGVNRYLKDFHGDADGEQKYIEEYQKQYRFFEYGVWSVVLKGTGEVIGRAGFSEGKTRDSLCFVKHFAGADGGECETMEDAKGTEQQQFGYVIGVPWQRQGLA